MRLLVTLRYVALIDVLHDFVVVSKNVIYVDIIRILISKKKNSSESTINNTITNAFFRESVVGNSEITGKAERFCELSGC